MENLHAFLADLSPWVVWLGVVVVSAIPFIESYGGAFLGVLANLHPAVALVMAVIGNVATMLVAVRLGTAARRRITGGQEPELTPRKARLKERFDKYGIAGVSLLGQTILPSQIVAATMVSFGADRVKVIVWQCVSIVLWGAAFAAFGMAVLAGVTA